MTSQPRRLEPDKMRTFLAVVFLGHGVIHPALQAVVGASWLAFAAANIYFFHPFIAGYIIAATILAVLFVTTIIHVARNPARRPPP